MRRASEVPGRCLGMGGASLRPPPTLGRNVRGPGGQVTRCFCGKTRQEQHPEGALGDPVDIMAKVKQSYKNVGKKEKQTELFPQLQAEIAKKRIELYKGVT